MQGFRNLSCFGAGFKRVFRWLVPERCVICEISIGDPYGICAFCLEEIELPADPCPRCGKSGTGSRLCGSCQAEPPWFDDVIAGSLYSEPVDEIIRQFKFSQKLYYGRTLAFLLHHNISSESTGPDLILSVPLHSSRLKQRGYNQSHELAKYLSRWLSVPCEGQFIERIRPTLPQTRLGQKQRKNNVKNAFKLNQEVAGMHVALMDDVMTTGSTVNEISRMLKKAGASKVSVWVVARA